MTHHRFSCANPRGTHRIAYTQWGKPNNPQVIICLHGLARNSRDFDFVAAALASDYRVICPDIIGHGDSDRLSHKEDYTYALFIEDMLALLAHLNLKTVDWLGSSMGGLIGIGLASQSNSFIKRLILNDIGPFISKVSLTKVADNLNKPQPRFENLFEAEQFMHLAYKKQLGHLTEAQWHHLTKHSIRLNQDGYYRLAYVPKFAHLSKKMATANLNLWSKWVVIACPVLLLHGKNSEILLKETITKMQVSHPEMQVVTFPDVGHTPPLMEKCQIQIIQQWLETNG
ncbi:alpha/beta hydrolase [Thiotrichales bacterium HSG14]|nr:alpha/beta hydrolase [Thiotrichales bacterium HSG14]